VPPEDQPELFGPAKPKPTTLEGGDWSFAKRERPAGATIAEEFQNVVDAHKRHTGAKTLAANLVRRLLLSREYPEADVEAFVGAWKG
jgi:hypothetical protein